MPPVNPWKGSKTISSIPEHYDVIAYGADFPRGVARGIWIGSGGSGDLFCLDGDGNATNSDPTVPTVPGVQGPVLILGTFSRILATTGIGVANVRAVY